MKRHAVPCDLHIHSHFSDGNLSPREIVRRAHAAGLQAVSITDHDTVLGQQHAIDAGRRYGIDILTGIELSIFEGDVSLHLIGYGIDPDNHELCAQIRDLAESRVERARRIVEKLTAAGVRISFERVLEAAGAGTVGRPHIAQVMLREGIVSNVQEAFHRYIGDSAACFVRKTVLSRSEVFRLVAQAGGVVVWAHPGVHIRNRKLLDLLRESGIIGLEVWHPNHSPAIEFEIMQAAQRMGLIQTGGSDYHFTEAMQADIGDITCPYEVVRELRRAAAR